MWCIILHMAVNIFSHIFLLCERFHTIAILENIILSIPCEHTVDMAESDKFFFTKLCQELIFARTVNIAIICTHKL